ncbi:MAG: arsenate reductase [Gammaproteobacteria bacterium]|nr:arsenate reductase [Gammaproteobacteria bacterium]
MKFYGLKNCDTCRKARRWLDENGIAHEVFDVREDGFMADDLLRWRGHHEWDALLNRRSTTWRNLPDADKQAASDDEYQALLLEHPTLLKRPLVETDEGVLVGFKPADWEKALK